MATTRAQEAICRLVEDGTLLLETEVGRFPNYSGLVVCGDTLMVVDGNACNLQLFSRHHGKLLSRSHELESRPRGVCRISKTKVVVILLNSKIAIMSVKSKDYIKKVNTLKITTGFNYCDAVARVKSTDKIVVSGRKWDELYGMMYWCVVSLKDRRVDSTHKICKGGFDSRSHLAIKDNMVYIACWAFNSTDNGVYAYDICNPQAHKFLYRHRKLNPPCGLTIDRRGFIFVCYSSSIHQLTDNGELVTRHTVSLRPFDIFYEDQGRVLYTRKSKEITRYKLEYIHQPGSRSLPDTEKATQKRNWRFWQKLKKERVAADTEKRWLVEVLHTNVQEVVMYTDEDSASARVDVDSNQAILIAVSDFTRRYPDEMSFSKGDRLMFIEKSLDDPGWWKARNGLDEVGLVPSNYMQTQRCVADDLPNIELEAAVHTNGDSIPSGVEARNNQAILIALHNYTGNHPDELSFSKGDQLIFIEKSLEDPGWWQARNSHGEIGLVPDNYVQSHTYTICKRYFRGIRSYLRDKPTRFHLLDEDIAIGNIDVDPRFQALKREIVDLESQQPYWGEAISARWLPLEQQLIKLRSTGIKVIPRSLVEDLARSWFVPISTDELELFLRYQHDIGTILYFSMEILKENIVLDPQWITDALTSLITAELFVLGVIPSVTDKWIQFKESGKLFPELTDHIWTKEKYPDFHDNKMHILLLMEQMNIIAKPMSWSEDSVETKEDRYFLVPCMLRQKMPKDVISHGSHPYIKSSSLLCCVFTGKFIPSSIFHRLLAACITIWPIAKRNLENLIFLGCCVFQIDHAHRLSLHFRDYVIFARVTKMSDTDENPDQDVCIQVRMSINTNLSKIIGCIGSILQYEWYIQCPNSDGDDLEKMFPVFQLQKWNELPCYFHDNGHLVSSNDVLKFWFKDQVNRQPIMQDHINYFRLEIALRNICGEALREILLKYVPADYSGIYQAIKYNQVYLTSNVLNNEQCQQVFLGPQEVGKVEEFDISLLYTLIKNISSIPAPSTGWTKPTEDTPVRDTTLEANVERIRFYRNHISANFVDGMCHKQAFEYYWEQINFVLSDIDNALGKQGYREKLDKCRNLALPS